MKQQGLTKRQILHIWTVTVLSLLAVCLLAALTLLVLELTAPPEPSGKTPPGPTTQQGTEPPATDTDAEDPAVDTGVPVHPRVLTETADAGQHYIDQMVFVGESTTAHLRNRGVLSGGTQTKQVWSNSLNTMMLDLNMLQKTICYPQTGEDMTIPAAVALAKPKMIVLSFGMNGIQHFERNTELYGVAYGRLITAIHEASPDTVVLLQTIYPVASGQTSFSESASEINAYTRKLNALLPAIAEQYDAYVVDTASCVTDGRGMLREDFKNYQDAIHLNADAYVAILAYLRTHAYVAP